MAGIDNIKRRLMPLMCNGGGGQRAPDMSIDNSASYRVTDQGTINLMSESCGEYNINPLGLTRKPKEPGEDPFSEGPSGQDITYRCAAHEMCVFNTIGWGASSIVRKAIHIPHHRIVALKRINVFDKEKRQQLLNEISLLCEHHHPGLVEFHGAYFAPDSGQISIALEYMDGGSLADIVRAVKIIPEPTLSRITEKVLLGLKALHTDRHLVHRDIKPANLLMNLNGEPKITDFGISAGLDNSIAMCATFCGTVTYMSPERINNERYSFPADIWSLGLTLLECGTGTFPYNAAKGPVNLMLQVMYDPSPTPTAEYSPEFRDFVDVCLRKDAETRPTAEQLLQHPFILKHANDNIDLASFVHSVFDPVQRLADLSEMLTTHYYNLFDGPEGMFPYLKGLFRDRSTMKIGGDTFTGAENIYAALCELRKVLSKPGEKLVHVLERLECCAYEKRGVMVRCMGAIAVGSQFIPASGTSTQDAANGPVPIAARTGPQRGTFSEDLVFEPGEMLGSFFISQQNMSVQVQA